MPLNRHGRCHASSFAHDDGRDRHGARDDRAMHDGPRKNPASKSIRPGLARRARVVQWDTAGADRETGRITRRAPASHRPAELHEAVVEVRVLRTAAEAGEVARDNTLVTVSYRRAVIRITPTSGVPVSLAAVTEAVTEQLQSFGLRPPVTARVIIDAAGKVGA